FKPNPATDNIQLLLAGQKQLKIYNAQGSMVFNKENFTAEFLAVDFLPSGIYLIVVESGNQVFTEKMVKK
ncbi:MAG: T9SS type A sorting domain-containing protein, partial [Bacteroidales bacterium]|nr:T9SS type A sorting domain-containing protein [Bacteroidales bacterium]